MASAMGLPSTSLQTPLTVPDWAMTGEAQSPSIKRTKANTTKCFFILASRRKTFSVDRFLVVD
jgi:hypothetical protein